MNWKYVKATQEVAITSVEEKFGIRLPKDLKNLILECNNGRPEKKCFDTDKSKGRSFKKLFSYNEADVENIFEYIPIVKAIDEKLFPIGCDVFGNFICLEDEKIVFVNHEDDSIEFIAESVTEFVERLY